MIKLNAVSYSSPPITVSNLSFNLSEGETAMILGPRKAGKTGFLKVCIGVIPIDNGEIQIMGKPLQAGGGFYGDGDRMQDIGFVTQNVTLLDNMTVIENIGLPLSYHLGVEDNEIRKRVMPIMEKLDITYVADKFPHEISADEARLAQMARAVVLDPKLLLMDEPTVGDLDPEGFLRVTNVIKSFHSEGMTMLISTCSFSLASIGGASCYYFIDGDLVPHSEAASSSNPKISNYLKEMQLYFEKQAEETTGFFHASDLDNLFKDS